MLTSKLQPLVPPGEKGSPGNPVTVEELEDLISKANGGADVKVKGFRELEPIDIAIMNIEKTNELQTNAPDAKISSQLRQSLNQSLKDINRKPRKLFEDRQRGLFLALDGDDSLWILEKETWTEIKEPTYPDLPQKEVT